MSTFRELAELEYGVEVDRGWVVKILTTCIRDDLRRGEAGGAPNEPFVGGAEWIYIRHCDIGGLSTWGRRNDLPTALGPNYMGRVLKFNTQRSSAREGTMLRVETATLEMGESEIKDRIQIHGRGGQEVFREEKAQLPIRHCHCRIRHIRREREDQTMGEDNVGNNKKDRDGDPIIMEMGR